MGFLERYSTARGVLDRVTPYHHFYLSWLQIFLQDLLNLAKQQGLISLPLNLPHNQDFLVLQYADDTLIFMKADARQLFFLKALLYSFTESTGLKVNFAKSMMVPVNVSKSKLDILARTLGCSKGNLPFTYLGLPLCLTKPTIIDFLAFGFSV